MLLRSTVSIKYLLLCIYLVVLVKSERESTLWSIRGQLQGWGRVHDTIICLINSLSFLKWFKPAPVYAAAETNKQKKKQKVEFEKCYSELQWQDGVKNSKDLCYELHYTYQLLICSLPFNLSLLEMYVITNTKTGVP